MARWLPPVTCREAQIRVEMLDPQGRFLHAATGQIFWLDPDPPNVTIMHPPPGFPLCPTHVVLIDWQAFDPCWLLAPNPYDLWLHLPTLAQWRAIAIGLPQGTNSYLWFVPADVPSDPLAEIVVRARDEAGNVGVHEMNEPVEIDRSRPTVRIRGVRPVGRNGERP